MEHKFYTYEPARELCRNEIDTLKGWAYQNAIFYYLRESSPDGIHNGRPYACVAIVDNGNGTLRRGVAYCAPGDQFKKKVGRALALQRLVDSYEADDDKFFEHSEESKLWNQNEFRCKFYVRAWPTDWEQQLLYDTCN